jgi:hypothetical protein
MNNLERRIERLEETLGMKPGPRYTLVTNVDSEGPCQVEFLPGLFALPYGGPLTSEEIQKLREEHSGGRL